MATTTLGSESSLRQRASWGAILTIVTVLGTWATACAMPFAGLVALAVLFLPRREAFVLIAVSWLASEAVGFTLLHYPHDWGTLRGGLELGVACMGSTAAATFAFARLRRIIAFPLAVVGTFAAAFLAYEGLCFLTSLGHHDGDFSPSVVLYIVYLNGLAFAGLLALQAIAEAIGVAVPRVFGQPASKRLSAA